MFSRCFVGFSFSIALTTVLPASSRAQVVVGQVDTFQNGTTQAWSQGPASPNPPLNISSGGPTGAGDAFLEIRSKGGAGAGSRLVAFNRQQWTGIYAPSVTSLGMDLENLGNTPLSVRVAFEDVNFNEYSSTTAFSLPATPGWLHAIFGLSDASMTQVAGTPQPFSTAPANGILEARILDSAAPSFDGDSLLATLGVDNITAVGSVPEPGTLAMTGAAVAGLLGRIGCKPRRCVRRARLSSTAPDVNISLRRDHAAV
jgi:hypothetical protein